MEPQWSIHLKDLNPLSLAGCAGRAVYCAIRCAYMIIGELDHPDFSKFDLSSLRTGVMAGSPCPVEVIKRMIELIDMREVEICYGMTETSSVSTQTHLDASVEKRVSTVGTINPHLEIKIVDPETGKVVPLGAPGELCKRL